MKRDSVRGRGTEQHKRRKMVLIHEGTVSSGGMPTCLICGKWPTWSISRRRDVKGRMGEMPLAVI